MKMDYQLREMLNNAGCREILENAENAGIDPAQDRSTLAALVDHLDKVLDNPSDSSRSHALAALQGLRRLPGNYTDKYRIETLLARHDPQDPGSADSGLPKPLPTQLLEDRWWKDTLRQLSDNERRHTIIAYLDRLKLIFGKHLRQCDNNSRKEEFY